MSSHCSFAKFVVATILLLSFLNNADGQIQVGLAEADITPPIGGRTSGYETAKPTDGVHDKLSARVILLKSDEANLALVSCDLCVFNSPWLHEQMPALGIDRLLFMNTHTHAGPRMDEDFPSKEKPWSKTVEEKVVDAIKEAQGAMFTGYFAASESHIQLGYNRLVRRGAHAVTYFDNPDRIPYGEVDTQVGVIRVTDESEKLRAVLVNYACHPVVLGNKNIKLSADFPGVMRRIVEEKTKDDAMCIFFQGGAGDINPLFLARDKDRSNDFEIVERIGEHLASEVLRALSFIKKEKGGCQSLKSLSKVTTFKHRFKTNETVDLGVTTILINDAIGIVTMPGEPFHKFGVDLRTQSNLKHVYMFGYCSNADYPWPNYLPDLESAARGGYGASENSEPEVGAGEKLINDGLIQLFKLRGRLKSEPMRETFEETKD